MKKAVNGLLKHFGVAIHGIGYLERLSKGEFKKDAFSDQARLLDAKKVKTIFDVGANTGGTINKYANLFPNAKIFGFEPFEETFKILGNSTIHNPNVSLHQLAISDNIGEETFYVNQGVDTNSLLPSIHQGNRLDAQTKTVREIRVKTDTIDHFSSKREISKIDILKLDIQGAELKALEGAGNLIKTENLSLIYLEVSFVQIYRDQVLFHEVFNYLNSNGFSLIDIYNPYYHNYKLVYADTIFIRQDLV